MSAPGIGCTVRLANGEAGVVVPLGRALDPARDVNVMGLDGSVRTIDHSMVGATLYDPRSTLQPVEYLTVEEVAERLRVSRMTIYRLCNAGDLPCQRVGRSFRVRPADLEAYLTRGLA